MTEDERTLWRVGYHLDPPEITVYEIDLALTRTGWVLTNQPATPEDVVAKLNREANRRSFGVGCADLMRGVTLSGRPAGNAPIAGQRAG